MIAPPAVNAPREIKIAELPVGSLWWRIGTLAGFEETRRLFANELAPAEALKLQARIQEAAHILNEMVCPGWQDWMDRRRAMN